MPRFAFLHVAALAAAYGLSLAPALAQSSTCEGVKKLLEDRRSLVQQLNSLSKGGKPADPQVACAALGRLVSNGNTTTKWLETNKDWCQVPDQFVEGFQKDHAQSQKLRGQACSVAAKVSQAQKMAKQQAQQGAGGNPKFGGGLEGTFKMPQGAL